MAPGPVPHHSPLWRDAHSFYLLSPLMGFFSRAWSRLRGPGAPEPWLVEKVPEAGQIEAEAWLTASLTPQGHHCQGEAEDDRTTEEAQQAAQEPHSDLKVSSSPLDAWGLSDDGGYSGGGGCTPDDLPTPLSPSLQGADKSPGEEVAGGEGGTELAYPSLHWEWCPATEGERHGEAVKTEGPRASPRSKATTWVYCPGEAVHQTTEEKGPENKAGEPSTSSSSSGSHPRAWECSSGKEDSADPQPSSQEGGEAGASWTPDFTGSTFLKAWVWRPGEDSEEEDDAESGSAEEEEAKISFCSPPPGDFLKAWVCQPGEDTEEEEDSDWESVEEEGETPSCTPPPSAFLKAWVCRPGEDTEEEDEEAAEASPATSLPSAFLKAWVCVPGEDTEEEDPDDSGAVLQAQGTPLCCQGCPPREESQEEPSPFRVAFYLPGQKPALPWAAPKLPLRLQRQLRSPAAPASQDPETPIKARKVRFSEKVTVHLLAVWAGPAQAARRGPWEQLARDRSRFARRIAQAQELLGPCFTPASRARAWARLGNPHTPLVPKPASSPAQAPPSSPPCETPLVLGLGLSGKRG